VIDTMLEREVAPVLDDGDHERFAHIVVPASAVAEAYVTGEAVTALCGKTWVPTRDPAGHNAGGPSVLIAYGAIATDRLWHSGLEGAFVTQARMSGR